MRSNITRRQLIKEVHLRRQNKPVKARPKESGEESPTWYQSESGTVRDTEAEE